MRIACILAVLAAPPGDVTVDDPPALIPGARGSLSLTVREAPARDLPLLVRVDTPADLVLVENRLEWSDVVDQAADQPRIQVRFRAPAEPGEYAARGSVTYWVCDEQVCRRRDSAVTWTVVVEPAPST